LTGTAGGFILVGADKHDKHVFAVFGAVLPRARGRTFGFPDAPAPCMGIRARRLRRRKAGGLHGAPGFEGAFEDDDDFVSSKPTSRYAEHRAFVERESARRRRKGAAMDWLIVLVGFLISSLATCVAFIVHLAFPVQDDGSGMRSEERPGHDSHGATGPRRGKERGKGPERFASYTDETRDAFAALRLDPDASLTLEHVAAAYRRMARNVHPDKNGGSFASSAAMQNVNAARQKCVAEVSRRLDAKRRVDEGVNENENENENDGGGVRDASCASRSRDSNERRDGARRRDGRDWNATEREYGAEKEARDDDAYAEEEGENDADEQFFRTREAADGSFDDARRLERLRARRAFIQRFLEISTRRDRRARHRRRATFGAAVVFVAVAVVAALYRRGAEARSDAAEWLASGIVVALGALAAATH